MHSFSRASHPLCPQTRDVLEAMRQDADCETLCTLFVDGGASQNDLLMQVGGCIGTFGRAGMGGGNGSPAPLAFGCLLGVCCLVLHL